MNPSRDALTLDERTVEAILTGRAPSGHDDLVAAVANLRSLVPASAPAPSALLAAMLDGGLPRPAAAPELARRKRPATRSVATVAAIVASLLGGVVGAAAANVLPAPVQSAVAAAVESLTPFHLPRPSNGQPTGSRGQRVVVPAVAANPRVPTAPAVPVGPTTPTSTPTPMPTPFSSPPAPPRTATSSTPVPEPRQPAPSRTPAHPRVGDGDRPETSAPESPDETAPASDDGSAAPSARTTHDVVPTPDVGATQDAVSSQDESPALSGASTVATGPTGIAPDIAGDPVAPDGIGPLVVPDVSLGDAP